MTDTTNMTDTAGTIDATSTIETKAHSDSQNPVAAPSEAEYLEKQRPHWQLKNVFWVIYSAIQMILRKYSDDAWKPLSDATYLETIDSSNGDPKTGFVGDQRFPRIECFYQLLERHFGRPWKGELVTCAQWQKYVGINNTIARIVTTIKQYGMMIQDFPNRDEYFNLYFNQPVPLVCREKYLIGLRSCIGYVAGASEKDHPYFA